MQQIIDRMHAILDEWSLLKHPFYQAWSEGTLPGHALSLYSREYASFIGTVAMGWEACGDAEIAEEEREHFALWKDFAASLGNEEVGAELPEVRSLVGKCEKAFSDYATALGALYAFENQQPATSASKLEGLRTHYQQLKADEVYFKVHVDDLEEPALLREKMGELNAEELQQALDSCETIAKELWNALTGIMHASGVEACA